MTFMSNIYEKCQISTFSNSGHTVVIQYPKSTNKMQLCRIIYYSLAAVCVSSDIFAHHQEHLDLLQLLALHTVIRSEHLLELYYTSFNERMDS